MLCETSHFITGMSVAFITLAGNAALIKKVGGYSNTKIHGKIIRISCLYNCLVKFIILKDIS